MDQQLPSTPQSPDDQHPGGLMRVRHNNAQYHGSPQANSDFSGTYGSPASSQWAHDPYLSDPQPLFDDYAQPGDGFGPEYVGLHQRPRDAS